MQKIPSLFERDWDNNPSLVADKVVEGSEWVAEGEGVATVKLDGTACMVKDGKLYRRRDRKRNRKTGEHKAAPPGWIAAEEMPNEHTGHWPGWMPVGDGPEDKYHREAWLEGDCDFADGTWELIGPKVQGNPEQTPSHVLVLHGNRAIGAPRSYDELRAFLAEVPIEGIVWHHEDGRMVKIKARDFGLTWPREE